MPAVVGITKPIIGSVVPNWVITNKGVGQGAVYAMLDAIRNHIKELAAATPALKGWTPDMMCGWPVVPFHDEAIKFYKDKGVWTKEVERRQAEILDE